MGASRIKSDYRNLPRQRSSRELRFTRHSSSKRIRFLGPERSCDEHPRRCTCSKSKLLPLPGKSVDWCSPKRLTHVRRIHLGFLFQHAQLLPFLTITEDLDVVGCKAEL